MALRRLHLFAGLGGLIAFALTGQYMDRWLDHLANTPDAPRLLYRSAHIYLLLSSAINTILGIYLPDSPAGGPRGVLRAAGSILFLAGPPLFVAAFAYEPHHTGLQRPYARPAIYAALAGTAAHLVASTGRKSA